MSDLTTGELSGWGRHPVGRARQRCSEDLEQITTGAVLTRGLGRSYGDASLPPPGDHAVAVTTRADRLLSFDLLAVLPDLRVPIGGGTRALIGHAILMTDSCE